MKHLIRKAVLALLFSGSICAEAQEVPFDVWSCAGMVEYREAHEMVSLVMPTDDDMGRCLAIGGSDGDQALATVEMGTIGFDSFGPDTWEPVSSMAVARQDFQAFAFDDVHVVVSGGYDGSLTHAGTEFYDAVSDVWSAGPDMVSPRTHHRAAWIDDTRLLITGGFNGVAETASCEVLDVATMQTTEVAPMLLARASHTLTPLGEGKFLVAGGFNAAAGFQLAECEVYDAVTDVWTAVAPLPVARDNHAAWTLPSSGGEQGVVLTGGRVFDAAANLFVGLAEGALFDPSSASWTPFDMTAPHSYHSMARIGEDPNWFVLGGVDASGSGVSSTYGNAEWGTAGTSLAWLPGAIGTGQNPDLLEDRSKAAMAPCWAGWVVTGGDATGIGTCAVVVGNTSGVMGPAAQTALSAYPNPAAGRVALSCDGMALQQQWWLVDGQGRVVLRGQGPALDVTPLTPGAYVLKLASGAALRLVVGSSSAH